MKSCTNYCCPNHNNSISGCQVHSKSIINLFNNEYHANYSKLVEEINSLKKILSEVLPEMEARLDSLNDLWPDKCVLTTIHRNEHLHRDIKKCLKK